MVDEPVIPIPLGLIPPLLEAIPVLAEIVLLGPVVSVKLPLAGSDVKVLAFTLFVNNSELGTGPPAPLSRV